MNGEKNPTEKVHDWADIRRDIQNETPNPLDFAGGNPYSDDEVRNDLVKIEHIKANPNYWHQEGTSDSEIQEYATTQEIGEMDWFGEELRRGELFPDGKGSDACAFMTSEFDNCVNHVDAICLINNACSDFRPIPFALDFTYNTDPDGLDKKFSWEHRSKQIASSGFCEVKYFEDTFNTKPLLPKGKISAMPRFIVGFNPELSEKITEERMTNTGWNSLSRDEPSNKAKFCVLKELKFQSEQMLSWLSEHHDSQELEHLYQDVQALNKYFDGALMVAEAHDPQNFESYSVRDMVAQSIMNRSVIADEKPRNYNYKK